MLSEISNYYTEIYVFNFKLKGWINLHEKEQTKCMGAKNFKNASVIFWGKYIGINQKKKTRWNILPLIPHLW